MNAAMGYTAGCDSCKVGWAVEVACGGQRFSLRGMTAGDTATVPHGHKSVIQVVQATGIGDKRHHWVSLFPCDAVITMDARPVQGQQAEQPVTTGDVSPKRISVLCLVTLRPKAPVSAGIQTQS